MNARWIWVCGFLYGGSQKLPLSCTSMTISCHKWCFALVKWSWDQTQDESEKGCESYLFPLQSSQKTGKI